MNDMSSGSKRDHQPESGPDPTSRAPKRNRATDEPSTDDAPSLEEYTVGWVCALPLEMAAAKGMLEKVHSSPSEQDPADHNSYILGELWGHRIVVACLPSGTYGTTPAATVAKDMLRTFKSIRFGLMVGIGGGIPSKKHDIRLGDVVVGRPTDTNGGVIQYDRGKTLQQDGFQRTGSLNAPPQVLLAALSRLQADHLTEDSRVSEFLEELVSKVSKRMKKKFSYQGVSNDYFFLSDYTHVDSEAECDQCDHTQVVKRKDREDTDPFIHYGTIGSGNAVIRDAKIRDELGKQLGVLCLEMEAAGLQDFPCIVIRGICDYSDSHKNKMWQEYAAATAAAFAKELLSVIPPSRVLQDKPIQQLVSIANEHLDVSKKHLDLSSEHLVEHRRTNRILEGRPIDLHIVHNARYDSADVGDSPRCEPNTRVRIQETIVQWADEDKGEPFLWVVGPAGTGKSTLIRSVSDKFHSEKRLSAGYFFKRGEQGRNDTNRFFSTLAMQLADTITSFKEALRASLGDTDKESMDKKDLRFQFEKLLKNPLERLPLTETTQSPIVMALDALDECERPENLPRILAFMSELCKNAPGTLRLRVLLASRPDPRVIRALESLVTDGSIRELQLHRIFPEDTKTDIRTYLHAGFTNIKSRVKIKEDPWPSVEDMHLLVHLATSPEPLFIYASTLLRFVYDEEHLRSPKNQLKIWLKQCEENKSQLHQIYNPILEQIFATAKDTDFDQQLQFLGALVLVAEPLSLPSLASLLDLDVDDINWWLPGLHPVLDIPPEPQKPIRLLHKSFSDYLLSADNPRHDHFQLKSTEIHALLADKCIDRMTRDGLKQDICELSKLDATPNDVDIETLDRCIPLEVQYACLHWVYHLQASGLPPDDRIYTFLLQHFLHWLEALSLLGCVTDGVDASRNLLSLIQNFAGIKTEFVDFVKDANRTIAGFGSIMESRPLQTYASLILFSPVESRIRQQFWDQRLPRFSRVEGVDPNWDAHIYTLDVYGDVDGLVFSPDGKLLASADSGSVRLWNASTGTHLISFDVKSYPSGEIQFSGNSQLLAALYGDDTLRVWDMTTWTQVYTLQCRNGSAASLIFSSDSQLLALASSSYGNGTVQIWNAQTGAHQKTVTLTAGNHGSWAIAVSPNFQLVARSCRDSISLWSMAAGTTPLLLELHVEIVRAMVFSPDSKLLVFSCKSKLQVWNTASLAVEYTLEDTDMELIDAIASIAFSPDGQFLASSSFEKVRLWNMATGSYWDIVIDHFAKPSLLAFSPDSQLMATSTMSHKIELWSTAYADQHSGGHPRKNISMEHNIAFSPNGRFVLSRGDETLQLWDAFTGTLRWSHVHEQNICGAHFSPDGKSVAITQFLSDEIISGYTCAVENGTVERMLNSEMKHFSCPVVYSEKAQLIAGCWVANSIQIHNATTGSYICTLEGHTDKIHAIAFSPNGQSLASVSKDMTIRLWDTTKGTLKHVLEQDGLGPRIRLVFSPDGEILALQHSGISLWSAVTGMHQCALPYIRGSGPLAISSDLAHLAISTDQYDDCIMLDFIELWNPRTGNRNSVLRGHRGCAIQIVFSPDSQQVAVASDDRIVRLWDTTTYVQRHAFRTHNNIPEMVRFSHDGQIIAAASSESTIRLWDTSTGRCLQMIQYEEGFLQEMTFVSNKLRISVSETDYNERWDLWNTLTLPVSTFSYMIAHEANASEPGLNGFNLDADETWIMKGSERIVLIPPQYRPVKAFYEVGTRPKRWASRGPVLFIGCLSGRVIHFRDGHSQ